MALIVVLSAIALRSTRPPAPVPRSAPDTAFSSERAMVHVRAIASEPHPVGTSAHARAREYVMTSLRSLGLQPEVQTTTAFRQRGTRVRAATVHNVIARIPGTRSTGAVALVSHYDSEVLTPGAADATSAVAAILEAARALRAGPPLANDIIVLITDAEESGLLGADAFVSEHRWARDVALVLNFEARGSGGSSYMFETGARNGWRLRAFAEHDPHPAANSVSYEVYRRMPNDTDFSVFRRAGIVGLNFAFIDDAHTYHQSFDTPEHLSEASLQHHGEHALALASHFGSVDLTAGSDADAVWVNFPGLGLVVYPATWAIPLAVLVVVLWIGLLVWGLRSRRARVRDVVAGGLLVPVALVLVNRGAHLLTGHLYPLHVEHDLLQGRAQYVEGWYLLAVVALTWLPVVGLWILARRWFRAGGAALGALLLPTALVLFAAVAAPGVTVVLQWPVLSALASVYLVLRLGEARTGGTPTFWWPAVLALPTLLILVPLLYLLFIAMNIELAPYLAVIAGVTLVLTYPLIDAVRRPNWWWSLVSALGLCAAFVAAGLLSRGVSTARPAPTALLYALD
ncbi:MAG: M28 family peptidase, partial [Gemmatimonadota bacterium]